MIGSLAETDRFRRAPIGDRVRQGRTDGGESGRHSMLNVHEDLPREGRGSHGDREVAVRRKSTVASEQARRRTGSLWPVSEPVGAEIYSSTVTWTVSPWSLVAVTVTPGRSEPSHGQHSRA